METKFTKGNWELHERDIKCNGKSIITCWTTNKIDQERLEGESWLDYMERTKEHRELHHKIEPQANAKLVAAAPDLLEALSNLFDKTQTLIEYTADQGFIDWEDETLEGVINMQFAKKMAIEALKKATE